MSLPDALSAHFRIVCEFEDWLRENSDAVVTSAELLGGEKWRNRATTTVDAIKEGKSAAEFTSEFGRLHRLFALDCVNDVFSEEARRFAAIHPDSAEAGMAMHVAEALQAALPSLKVMNKNRVELFNAREAA